MTHVIKHASLWATTAFGVMWLLIFGWFNYGPHIENIVMPVYGDVKLTFIVVNKDSSDIMFVGVKNRNCQAVGTRIQTFVNGVWVPARITIDTQLDDPPHQFDNPRIPVGAQFFRIMRVAPGGTAAKIKLEARCHPLWVSHQTLPSISAEVSQDNSQ